MPLVVVPDGGSFDDAVRAAVFGHYGQVCACTGCGATERLEIDHVNGDGKEHRAQLGFGRSGGIRFYVWLIKNGFPPGFQTLCHWCNVSKRGTPACRLHHGAR